jgi:hypothetical protein
MCWHGREPEKARGWCTVATHIDRPVNHMAILNHACWTQLPLWQLCVCYWRLVQHQAAYAHNELAHHADPTPPHGAVAGDPQGPRRRAIPQSYRADLEVPPQTVRAHGRMPPPQRPERGAAERPPASSRVRPSWRRCGNPASRPAAGLQEPVQATGIFGSLAGRRGIRHGQAPGKAHGF